MTYVMSPLSGTDSKLKGIEQALEEVQVRR
jgi:hypothetical protein